MRRGIVILVGAAILAIALWFLTIDRMFECEVTHHAALPSPDRSKQAVVFDVDCGATTGFNTQVAIKPTDAEFDRGVTPAILIMDGRWSLPIRWADDQTLYIRIPKDERYYRKLTSAGGVLVTYEDEESVTRLP